MWTNPLTFDNALPVRLVPTVFCKVIRGLLGPIRQLGHLACLQSPLHPSHFKFASQVFRHGFITGVENLNVLLRLVRSI